MFERMPYRESRDPPRHLEDVAAINWKDHVFDRHLVVCDDRGTYVWIMIVLRKSRASLGLEEQRLRVQGSASRLGVNIERIKTIYSIL
jgi:hypothetical protein